MAAASSSTTRHIRAASPPLSLGGATSACPLVNEHGAPSPTFAQHRHALTIATTSRLRRQRDLGDARTIPIARLSDRCCGHSTFPGHNHHALGHATDPAHLIPSQRASRAHHSRTVYHTRLGRNERTPTQHFKLAQCPHRAQRKYWVYPSRVRIQLPTHAQ